MKRSEVISNHKISPGDIIVGMASHGRATYESEYNGGMGSNGLTSARHDVFGKYLADKFPESFDPGVPDDLVYSGSKKLIEEIEGTGLTAGKLVLSPTRTYGPIIKKVIDEFRGVINGMIHCSGGAQTKVMHFVDGVHIIKDNFFSIPPLFKMIQEESGTEWKEMYKVFNMGHRMEVYLPEEYAKGIIQISKSFGVDAQIVGRVEASKQNKLTLKSEFGNFEY
jgi:phosphoribosylformylglycinamidine cyclo-ligase